MSDQQIDPRVYVGLWQDWSAGSILGSTLTLTRRDGNFLIAFTASFIAFIAARLWRIVCFVYHRHLSSSAPRSTLHHQRQIILRNSSSPDAAAWSLLQLGLAWRNSTQRRNALAVTAPPLSLALTIWTAFTLAAGFSSAIASGAGNTVLLQSTNCGVGNWTYYKDDQYENDRTREISDRLNNAVNYARQCYSEHASGFLDCGRFVRPSLSWQVDNNASCPFEEVMCRRNEQNLRLDTGLIDTNSDLGVNVPPDERVAVRYVLHCAPLVTEGFTTQAHEKNATLVRYHYGAFGTSTDGPANFTLQMRDVESQYEQAWDPLTTVTNGNINRLISVTSMNKGHQPSDGAGGFVPIEQLFRSDGDTAILFLAGNGVEYTNLFRDDWYRGTAPRSAAYLTQSATIQKQYWPEEAASPLGCFRQMQYCNLALPGDSGCGALSGVKDSVRDAASLFNTTAEAATSLVAPEDGPAATRLWWHYMLRLIQGIESTNIIGFTGSRILESQRRLFRGTQIVVEHNESSQWHLDVQSWFGSTLAALQAAYAFAPFGPDHGQILESDYSGDEMLKRLCDSQKIRSNKYTSFNVFGLCFTYAVGGFIILVSAALEPALAFCGRHFGYQEYQQAEWTTNSALQLHRLAEETCGYGSWWNGSEVIPLTRGNATLGALNLSDKDHPVIIPFADTTCQEQQAEGKHANPIHNDGSTQSSSFEGKTSARENKSFDENQPVVMIQDSQHKKWVPTPISSEAPVSPRSSSDDIVRTSSKTPSRPSSERRSSP